MPKKIDFKAAIIVVVISAAAIALSYSYNPSQVACTMDAKICPDGSFVGRMPPSCEFAPCPVSVQSCETDSDCVPAQCCHPNACVNKAYQEPCDDVDCGAGSCGCVNGTCSVLSA